MRCVATCWWVRVCVSVSEFECVIFCYFKCSNCPRHSAWCSWKKAKHTKFNENTIWLYPASTVYWNGLTWLVLFWEEGYFDIETLWWMFTMMDVTWRIMKPMCYTDNLSLELMTIESWLSNAFKISHINVIEANVFFLCSCFDHRYHRPLHLWNISLLSQCYQNVTVPFPSWILLIFFISHVSRLESCS